jgi:hypothetical protein
MSTATAKRAHAALPSISDRVPGAPVGAISSDKRASSETGRGPYSVWLSDTTVLRT